MARDFFKNLPNTTTPITAPRMNALLDGDEPMGNIVVDSISSKNMIPGWFYGGIDSTNGSETTSSDARRTGYIDVDFTNTTNYYISGMPQSSTNIRHFICAYNSSKQFLGRTGGSLGTTENITSSVFTSGTPQGTGDVKYIRINIYSGASDSDTTSIQLEKGSSATTFVQGKALGYISGGTANGNYIKYDDGTLIQWGEVSLTTGTTSVNRGGLTLYASSQVETSLPISFLDASYSLSAQINGGTGQLNFIYWIAIKNQTRFILESTNSNYTRTVRWIAVGRWK